MEPNRTVLLFDMMDTVIYDPFHREVPETFDLSLEELRGGTRRQAWVDFELDRIDEPTFFRRFFADGMDIDPGKFKQAHRENYRWMEGMKPLLEDLSRRNQPMHVMSNYPRWYEMIEQKFTLSRYLPWSFVSCRTGHRKPDPEAYRVACHRLNRDPGDFLFIDNKEENCQGAREVGMRAHRYRSTGDLVERLREEGVGRT